jgi:shikimate kinase
MSGAAAIPLPRPRLVLVGPPGSGKTSVGRALATAWSVSFRDTDDDVEKRAGLSISDLFVEQGEEHFRALEKEAVLLALTEHDGVLALGGGSVIDAETRAALEPARVTFLDVGLAEAMDRLQMNRSRPLLLGNVRGRWLALLEQRRPFYDSVSDEVVPTDGRSVADIVAEIDQFWRIRP